MTEAASRMMQVLLVGDPGATDELLAETLIQAPDVQLLGTATKPAQAFNMARAMQPDVILVDGGPDGSRAPFWTQEMVTQWPSAPIVVVVPEAAVDIARDAILAGARMFVPRPFRPDDLLRTLHQVHALELQRRVQTSPVPLEGEASLEEGRIFVIFAPKGGVGRTTVAINLAVALQQATKGQTVLVDGAVQFGGVALALNIRTPYSIMDLLQNVEEMDNDMMNGILANHPSGIRVLSASTRIELPEAVQPGPLRSVLSQLRGMFDYVVVDTWPQVDETSLAILEMADKVVLLLTPDITALRNTQSFLELAESLQYPTEKIMVVMNQVTAESAVRPADAEEILGRPVSATIASDPGAVSHALNRGVPLLLSHKRSRAARDIVALAKKVAGPTQKTQRAPKSASRSRGIVARIKGEPAMELSKVT